MLWATSLEQKNCASNYARSINAIFDKYIGLIGSLLTARYILPEWDTLVWYCRLSVTVTALYKLNQQNNVKTSILVDVSLKRQSPHTRCIKVQVHIIRRAEELLVKITATSADTFIDFWRFKLTTIATNSAKLDKWIFATRKDGGINAKAKWRPSRRFYD